MLSHHRNKSCESPSDDFIVAIISFVVCGKWLTHNCSPGNLFLNFSPSNINHALNINRHINRHINHIAYTSRIIRQLRILFLLEVIFCIYKKTL